MSNGWLAEESARQLKQMMETWMEAAQRRHVDAMQDLKQQLLDGWCDIFEGGDGSKERMPIIEANHFRVAAFLAEPNKDDNACHGNLCSISHPNCPSVVPTDSPSSGALSKGKIAQTVPLAFPKKKSRAKCAGGSNCEGNTACQVRGEIERSVLPKNANLSEKTLQVEELVDNMGFTAQLADKIKKSKLAKFMLSAPAQYLSCGAHVMVFFCTVAESNCRMSRTLFQPQPWHSLCETRIFFYAELVVWIVDALGVVAISLVLGKVMLSDEVGWWVAFSFVVVFLSFFYFVGGFTPNCNCFLILYDLANLNLTRSPMLIRVTQKVSNMVELLWLSIPIWISATVALFIIVSLSSVVMSFAINHGLQNNSIKVSLSQEDQDDFVRWFGTFEGTVLTLFQVVTGGSDWHSMMDLFSRAKLGAGVQFWFLAYIILTILGVLNLVTSMFVQQSVEASEKSVSFSLHHEEEAVARLKHIFAETDSDKSGTVSWSEFESRLSDRRVSMCLASMDLNVNELRVAFEMLDTDGTGNVTIDDFVWGCMRLKGTAKSVDLCALLYEHRRSMQAVESSFDILSERMSKLDDKFSVHVKENSGRVHISDAHTLLRRARIP